MPRELGDLLTLKELQAARRVWADHNFPNETALEMLAGMTEELGECAHGVLKMEQGIRGDAEKHKMEAFDACGDIIIYMCGLADALGFTVQDAVEYAWAQVKNRDWKKNAIDGKVA